MPIKSLRKKVRYASRQNQQENYQPLSQANEVIHGRDSKTDVWAGANDF